MMESTSTNEALADDGYDPVLDRGHRAALDALLASGPRSCDACGKELVSEQGLRIHMGRMHAVRYGRGGGVTWGDVAAMTPRS